GCSDRNQESAHGLAVAQAVAGDLVSAARAALPRHPELPSGDLHVSGTPASGRRGGPARSSVDYGLLSSSKGFAKSSASGKRSNREISERSFHPPEPGASSRRERPDGRSSADAAQANCRR